MKSLFIMVFAVAAASFAQAQQYKPVDSLSEVKFIIKNFGINTPGSFHGLTGKINFSVSNPSAGSFDVSVDAATVSTGMDMRDNHLRKEEYFNVGKYPAINFISTKITTDGAEPGTYIIFGRLTIKGVTREVSFPFKVTQQTNGLTFSGKFNINRKDFNVGGSAAVLGNNVELNLKVFARKN